MEGLEVSILNISELKLGNDRFRFDAEFSKKEYLKIGTLLESKKYKKLIDTDAKIIHPSEIKREYVENGEWFLRTQNIRPLKIEKSNNVYISVEDAKTLINNEIKIGDVLITRTGANYGQTALYNRFEKAFGSSHVLILRNTYFNQSYLAVFFNTHFGKKMIDKGMYGAAQPEIAPYYLLNIPIPIFSETFQIKIEKVLSKSFLFEKDVNYKYNDAETLLLETLGLNKFQPSSDPVNVKSFKDSFGSTGRLDAEYYQKKYEIIENFIKKFKLGMTSISNEFSLSKNIIDRNKDYYNYTEISDINVSDGSVSYNKLSVDDLPDNGKMVLKAGHIIISKVRPYRGAIGIIRDCPENYVGSGAFTILSEKGNYKKEVLQTILRSKPYRELIMKYNVGSSYPVVKDEDILNLSIPRIDNKSQLKITELVDESFLLKKQSEQLLEKAKRAVEIAIEENEVSALNYLNKTIN